MNFVPTMGGEIFSIDRKCSITQTDLFKDIIAINITMVIKITIVECLRLIAVKNTETVTDLEDIKEINTQEILNPQENIFQIMDLIYHPLALELVFQETLIIHHNFLVQGI
jgi:hypothetical protein